ncbi:MAG TPA: hypothetical protein VK841_01770 [Polyangiaceae bacterium]|jgi:hypothetical protein|nr:hypothetical protein [Polyangiaceae bacterium]
MRPVERFAPLAVGLAFAVPVLWAAFPPMDDLPLHEAGIGLLRHWADPRFVPRALYFVNLGHSNQLFSLIVLALSYLLPIAWATKVGVALVLVALPVGAARFADYLEAPRWTALLVAPLGFGWLFFWGLVQNMLGLAVLLMLLPAIDRFAANPTTRGAIHVCGAMVLLHFAHQAMQMAGCGALLVGSIGVRQNSRSVALRLAVLVFSGLVILSAYEYAWHLADARHLGTPDTRFVPLDHKLFTMPGVLFGGFEPYIRNSMMALALVPVVLFALDRAKNARHAPAAAVPTTPSVRPLGARFHALRFEVFALVLLVVYFAAPSTVKSTTLVYHRALPPVWAILAVSLAAGTRRTARFLPRALCPLLPLGSLLIAWPTFVDSNRVYSNLRVLLPRIDPGSAVLVLESGERLPGRLWNPSVVGGSIVAERGGRTMIDYTQSPISVVAQYPNKEWAEVRTRIKRRVFELRPAWDFTRFRYFLFECREPELGAAVTAALTGYVRLVAVQGDFLLFESILPLVPIDADDAPVPVPRPPTLAQILFGSRYEPGPAPEEPASSP